jgi:hypothetical protein
MRCKKILLTGFVILFLIPHILTAQYMDFEGEIWQLKNYSNERISSYDRTGANDDGNWKNKIQPGETRIIGDVQGPGIIKHIWVNTEGPTMGK